LKQLPGQLELSLIYQNLGIKYMPSSPGCPPEFVPKTPARLPLLLYSLPFFGGCALLYSLGLIIGGLLAGGSFPRLLALLSGVLIFWLIWLSGKKPAYLYYTGLGTVTVLVAVGLLAAANLDDDYLRFNSISEEILKIIRSVSPFLDGLKMHRNTLAGMLAVFAPLSLAYGLLAPRRWERRLGLGNSLGLFGLLLVTNSRGGLATFIVGGLLVAGLGWRQVPASHRRRLVGWGLALSGIMGVYLIYSGQYQLFTLESLLNENGLSRLEIWKNSLYMLGDVPLTGYGPGNFQAVYPFYIDPSPVSGGASQEHSHNLFIQSYGEAGLAGLLAIAGVFCRWLALLWETLRRKACFAGADPAQQALTNVTGLGGLAALGSLFVYGLTEDSTWNGQFTPLFWLPMALVAGSYRRKALPAAFEPGLPAKFRPRFNKYLVVVAVVMLMLPVGWQLWGLALVNRAGLESQQIWLGSSRPQLTQIGELYRQAENITGWSGIPLRGEAWVALQQGDTEKAGWLLRQIIQNQPDDQRSLLLLGDLLAASGQPGGALALWRRASAAPIFVARGRRLLDSSDDTRSEPYFLQAQKIDPHLWDSYKYLTLLYQRHGRTAEAIVLLEQSQVFLPGDARPSAELSLLRH
jgi:hypothetical protein